MRIAGMRRVFAVLCAGSALLYAAGCGLDLRIDVQEEDSEPNRPPVAYAGMDQSVLVASVVTLDASGSSDPDGDRISYSWALQSAPLGSLAALTGPATVYPTFTADMQGTYTFLLTVSDGKAASLDYVNVTAAVPNAAPVAVAGPDKTVVTGTTVVLDGTGSYDPDGDPLSYLWTFVSVPVGSMTFLLNESTAAPSFLADAGGTYVIQLIVSDGYATSAADTISVTAGGQAPPVADAGPDQAVSSGSVVTLDGSGSYDPNTEPITYDWFFVSYPTAANPVLDDPTLVDPSFTANVAGDYVIGLIVNDGTSDSAQDNVVVTATGGSTYYRDADGDGYGDPASSVQAAVIPTGYVVDNTDCDDTVGDVYPGAPEICDAYDNDCIAGGAQLNNITYYTDGDSDDWGDDATAVTPSDCIQPAGTVTRGGDCDDTTTAVNPDITETCNGVDDDCDGNVDEGLTTTFYPDADNDNYGGDAGAIDACVNPGGWLTTGGDCNDADFDIKPGVVEICDAVDNNCDPSDDQIWTTYYQDNDADGYGNPSVAQNDCTQPGGYVLDNTDCNDANADISPEGAEICNGVDDDCDGTIDDGVKTTFYADTDSDGYGDPLSTTQACTLPLGYAANNADCDDTNTAINPLAAEVCDAVDNNCNPSDDLILATYYQDSDSDNFGNPASSTDACALPAGYVTNSADCDDTNGEISPAGTEVCNGVDDDCDGNIDEGMTTSYYPDVDGDDYGNQYALPTEACSQPAGYVTDNTDCNDMFPAINPGEPERCSNGLDDDCNGITDAEACLP